MHIFQGVKYWFVYTWCGTLRQWAMTVLYFSCFTLLAVALISVNWSKQDCIHRCYKKSILIMYYTWTMLWCTTFRIRKARKARVICAFERTRIHEATYRIQIRVNEERMVTSIFLVAGNTRVATFTIACGLLFVFRVSTYRSHINA